MFQILKVEYKTLNDRKIFFCVCCGADKRVVGFCYAFVSFAFWFSSYADNRQTTFTWTSRKHWCQSRGLGFVCNIVVSEIEQKTILQFKTLKINLFFIELLPWHEEKSATDHANKTYNPSKCLCLLERPCII